MKRLNELTIDECQIFLNEIFEDDNVKFNKMIFETNKEGDIGCGIEYQYENEHKNVIPFSNPDLITCFYKHDVDLTIPLKQLRVDFIDMDEKNSILFEYAMDINKVLRQHGPINKTFREAFYSGMDKIEKLQKELIDKL